MAWTIKAWHGLTIVGVALIVFAATASAQNPPIYWSGITLPQGSGVRVDAGMGDAYIKGGQMLGIPNPATLSCLGLGPDDSIIARPADVQGFSAGPVASCADKISISTNGWSQAAIGAHDDMHEGSCCHSEGWAWATNDGHVLILQRWQSASLTSSTCAGLIVGVYDNSGTMLERYTPPSGCGSSGGAGNVSERWQPYTNTIDPNLLSRVTKIAVTVYDAPQTPAGSAQKAQNLANGVAKLVHAFGGSSDASPSEQK